MKTQITLYNQRFTGDAFGNSKPVITLAKLTTTTGMLWWKKVEERDVWVVRGLIDIDTSIGGMVDIDTYWTTLKTFEYDELDLAVKFLNDINSQET